MYNNYIMLLIHTTPQYISIENIVYGRYVEWSLAGSHEHIAGAARAESRAAHAAMRIIITIYFYESKLTGYTGDVQI